MESAKKIHSKLFIYGFRYGTKVVNEKALGDLKDLIHTMDKIILKSADGPSDLLFSALSSAQYSAEIQLFLRGLFKTIIAHSQQAIDVALSEPLLDVARARFGESDFYILPPHIILHTEGDDRERIVFHRDSLPSEKLLISWIPLGSVGDTQELRFLRFSHFEASIWEWVLKAIPRKWGRRFLLSLTGKTSVFRFCNYKILWSLAKGYRNLPNGDALFFLGETFHSGHINQQRQPTIAVTNRYKSDRPSVPRYVTVRGSSIDTSTYEGLLSRTNMTDEVQPYLNSLMSRIQNGEFDRQGFLFELKQPFYQRFPRLGYFMSLFMEFEYPPTADLDSSILSQVLNSEPSSEIDRRPYTYLMEAEIAIGHQCIAVGQKFRATYYFHRAIQHCDSIQSLFDYADKYGDSRIHSILSFLLSRKKYGEEKKASTSTAQF